MAAVIVHLPPAEFWRSRQPAVEAMFGNTPRIICASIIAFWCGSFVNSYVLAKMKIWSNGRWLWTRLIGSTVCGELIDTALFYTIAFAGLWTLGDLVSVALDQYVLKSLWEVIATPATYRIVAFLKRAEQEDYYDRGTDFTPFSLKA
jgi:queuosine precursor transporter